jgi:hypothetical protein
MCFTMKGTHRHTLQIVNIKPCSTGTDNPNITVKGRPGGPSHEQVRCHLEARVLLPLAAEANLSVCTNWGILLKRLNSECSKSLKSWSQTEHSVETYGLNSGVELLSGNSSEV